MAGAAATDDIDTCVLKVAVGLLDALLDGSTAAIPGRDAARYAVDFHRLAETAALAAADLATLLDEQRMTRKAVA